MNHDSGAGTRLLALVAMCVLMTTSGAYAQDAELVVWHAYGEGENEALTAVIEAFEQRHPSIGVHAVRLPFGVLASRLESAVPTGNGPDLFIDAHERLGRYIARGVVQPALGDGVSRSAFEDAHLDALRYDGEIYGWPLSAKALALFVNRGFVSTPDGRDLDALLRVPLPEGVWPLAVEGEDAYFAAPFFHAFGATLFDDGFGLAQDGVVDPAATAAVRRIAEFFDEGLIPPEPSGELVQRLFAGGHAAYAISGPWLAASLPDDLNYEVVPLPSLADAGPMRPFVTIEAVFFAANAETSDPSRARAVATFAAFLAGEESAILRGDLGGQVVSHRAAWDHFEASPATRAFRAAALRGQVMSSDAHMSQVFEPTTRAIRLVVRGGLQPDVALLEAETRFENAVRPLPPARDSSLALFLVGLMLLLITGVGAKRMRERSVRQAIRASVPAYRYLAAAFVAVLLLVIAPLVVGASMSLFATDGSELRYVGMTHFVAILSDGSFWRVLLVTATWTALNLFLHVVIGVALALALHRPVLRMRAVYRVLLILPWAVPNYVTALSWKGMFHSQYGAVNALLGEVGVGPVQWFSRFSTAFAANVTTNVWLGFPFMMVVALGALSAIPKELYEAARVDGATPFQRLRYITLPILWPSLLPAVAMGAVWTFNMFNVVFLVSGGEPGGSTEILVSEAYRWAFTRGARYGYAAAYAVLIFGVLWLATRTRGVGKALR